jgi:hypothetical protein
MEQEKSNENPSALTRKKTFHALGNASFGLSIALVSLSFLFAGIAGYFYHQSKWHNDFLAAIILVVFFSLFVLTILSSIYVLIGFFLLRKTEKRSFALPIVLSCLSVCSAIGVLSDYLLENHFYDETYSYTPEKWAKASAKDRYKIWPYFEKDHALIGESQDQVLAYLGHPDEGQGTEEWTYSFDFPEGLILLDPLALKISFASSGTVNMYSVYEQ